MPEATDTIIAYHEATKHHYQHFARGPERLDWANQPDPFRRYGGAPLVALEHPEEAAASETSLTFAAAVVGETAPALPVDAIALARFFYHSLALSAWKQVGAESWPLRVNPSSGNLHPTEGYLIGGALPELWERPVVAHYAPREHGLEIRAELSEAVWSELSAGLPPDSFLIALTSIHWREVWKYGERSFRYCQHDVGHAIAALSYAASLCGWRARLIDDLGHEELVALCGLHEPWPVEKEIPDCLVVIAPSDAAPDPAPRVQLPASWADLSWVGQPEPISLRQRDWPLLSEAAAAVIKENTTDVYAREQAGEERPGPLTVVGSAVALDLVIRTRRSAVQMDGQTAIDRYTFFGILACLVPGAQRVPFAVLPWRPRSDLIVFVHRVAGLVPGIYILLRDDGRRDRLRGLMRPEFSWKQVPDCPEELQLSLLMEGEVRDLARALSCMQDIAADGCFSLGMISEFAPVLDRLGAWAYSRLFWECGIIGQALYLAAEAAGLRGTGIGCYFDDSVHEVLGLQGDEFQSLYHFTVGGPLEDDRLTNLPAYPVPAAEG